MSGLVLGWGTPYGEGMLPAADPFSSANEGSVSFSYNSAPAFGFEMGAMDGYEPAGPLSVIVKFLPQDGGPEILRVFDDVSFGWSQIYHSDWLITESPTWPYGDQISGVYEITAIDGNGTPSLNTLFLSLTSLEVEPGGYSAQAWHASAPTPPEPVDNQFWTGFRATEELGGSDA